MGSEPLVQVLARGQLDCRAKVGGDAEGGLGHVVELLNLGAYKRVNKRLE